MVDMAKVEKLRKFGQALQNFGALQSGDTQKIALAQQQMQKDQLKANLIKQGVDPMFAEFASQDPSGFFKLQYEKQTGAKGTADIRNY